MEAQAVRASRRAAGGIAIPHICSRSARLPDSPSDKPWCSRMSAMLIRFNFPPTFVMTNLFHELKPSPTRATAFKSWFALSYLWISFILLISLALLIFIVTFSISSTGHLRMVLILRLSELSIRTNLFRDYSKNKYFIRTYKIVKSRESHKLAKNGISWDLMRNCTCEYPNRCSNEGRLRCIGTWRGLGSRIRFAVL